MLILTILFLVIINLSWLIKLIRFDESNQKWICFIWNVWHLLFTFDDYYITILYRNFNQKNYNNRLLNNILFNVYKLVSENEKNSQCWLWLLIKISDHVNVNVKKRIRKKMLTFCCGNFHFFFFFCLKIFLDNIFSNENFQEMKNKIPANQPKTNKHKLSVLCSS